MDPRIKYLIGVHVVAFIIATIATFHRTGPDVATLSFVAIVFADSSTLGLWAALGKSPWHARFSALTGTLVCFWLTMLAAQPHSVEARDVIGFFFLFGLPATIIVLVLSVLRWGKRQLTLRRTSEFPTHEGFQFSLKHLLLATTIVAIVLSIGRAVRTLPRVGGYSEVIAIIATATPCFVLIELAAFWGSLGLGRPLPRLLVVLPVAFLVGLVPPFYFNRVNDMQQFVVWCWLTGTTTIIIAASLLVVRSAGWRLCSTADEGQSAAPAVQQNDHE
jgi:hypothetical protein